MDQSELWLLILGMPILVAILSFFARASPFRPPRALAVTAFGNAFPSASTDPSALPSFARRPEQAAAAEIDRQEAALLICRELGNRKAEGEVLGRLGLSFAALGATSQAVEAYRERLELAQEMGDWKSEASTLDNLSLAYAELGEIVRAQECHGAARRIYLQFGDPRLKRNALSPGAEEPADRRQARHALESLAQQVALGQPFGFWQSATPQRGADPIERQALTTLRSDRTHLYADFERQLDPPDALRFEAYLAKLRERRERM